ncbi:hypothetical protein EW145_g4200 [Phellinidium pouzarii]|uniref:TM7S3/TM198-like domain-containing protein n=1 Tax=Phellinidium pouzarii TaxID=167371 RepID=A0A4S4L4K6_9AGAM|nr:hypothetical protein EW145_g4200 [Phellinidium pouzarii]
MAFCFSASQLWFLFCLLSFTLLVVDARPSAFSNGTSDILSNVAGTFNVTDPDTGIEVPQGSASDGAGSGMNVPAIIWIICAFVVGVPIATAGVRLGRFTSGVGLGLAVAVGIWASIVNTVSEFGISDIVIFALTVGLFAIAFVLGFAVHHYGLGGASLSAVGGVSFGIRVMLLKHNLLVPVFYVNWLISAAFGLAGIFILAWNERVGVIIGSSAAGSFLIALGVDLLVNKQDGMSRGLRYLFDRNANHIVDIIGSGYRPPVSTIVIMAVTILAIPIFAFLQHKLFTGPFRTISHRPSSVFSYDGSITERSWFERITGRKAAKSRDVDIDVEKESKTDSTRALVSDAEESTKEMSPPNTPVLQRPFRDEPERQPTKEGTLTPTPTLTSTPSQSP